MKYKVFPMILALLLLVALLPGCSLLRAADTAEDRIEDQIDRVEDQIENKIEQKTETTPTISPDAAAADIGKEKAEQIALEHAGFTAENVQRLRTDAEFDDGVHYYEVQFHVGPVEYEYDIHAATGEILSFDID